MHAGTKTTSSIGETTVHLATREASNTALGPCVKAGRDRNAKVDFDLKEIKQRFGFDDRL